MGRLARRKWRLYKGVCNSGDVIICEEDFKDVGPFTYTVPNPDDLSVSWTVPSSWETYETGNTLIITGIDFDPNPTFPQYETIYVTVGSNSDSHDVEVQDCEQNGAILLLRLPHNGSIAQLNETESEYLKPDNGDLSDYDIQVYPNPTNGAVTVSIPEEIVKMGSELHIFNAGGAHINRVSLNSAISTIELPYSAGIYFMEIIAEKREKVYACKIVIHD